MTLCDASPHTPAQLPQKVEAIIFDMDDTLVDSEHAWVTAANQLWQEGGATHPAPLILGGTLTDLVTAFCTEFPQANPDASMSRLATLLDEALGTAVQPMPGAAELLARLHPSIPLAVASNSPTAVVHRTITGLGWNERMHAMLGTDDVARPKPAPDLYVEAARRCGADIRRCVIMEDSPMGARAALDAGAFVVTLAPTDIGHLTVSSLLDPRITAWTPEPVS